MSRFIYSLLKLIGLKGFSPAQQDWLRPDRKARRHLNKMFESKLCTSRHNVHMPQFIYYCSVQRTGHNSTHFDRYKKRPDSGIDYN